MSLHLDDLTTFSKFFFSSISVGDMKNFAVKIFSGEQLNQEYVFLFPLQRQF